MQNCVLLQFVLHLLKPAFCSLDGNQNKGRRNSALSLAFKQNAVKSFQPAWKKAGNLEAQSHKKQLFVKIQRSGRSRAAILSVSPRKIKCLQLHCTLTNLHETLCVWLDSRPEPTHMLIFSQTHSAPSWRQEMTKIGHVTHFNELLLQIWSECHEIWCEHSSDLWHENLLKSFWSD